MIILNRWLGFHSVGSLSEFLQTHPLTLIINLTWCNGWNYDGVDSFMFSTDFLMNSWTFDAFFSPKNAIDMTSIVLFIFIYFDLLFFYASLFRRDIKSKEESPLHIPPKEQICLVKLCHGAFEKKKLTFFLRTIELFKKLQKLPGKRPSQQRRPQNMWISWSSKSFGKCTLHHHNSVLLK